jgi:ABC-2 type transport system ATP-binding protein
MLQFKNVSKQYYRRTIVQVPDVSLSGHYWLRGSNGSGKSTLLKMIGGLIPFEGNIDWRDVNLKTETVKYRKMVSYAEAEPLYPTFLTGRDLISFFNQTRNANIQKTNLLIDGFKIATFIDNPIGTYSSGMVKKLSLVLALIGETELLLLDEPLVTLDKEAIAVLYECLHARALLGNSIVFTSHQAFDVPSLSIQSLEVSNNQLWIR